MIVKKNIMKKAKNKSISSLGTYLCGSVTRLDTTRDDYFTQRTTGCFVAFKAETAERSSWVESEKVRL